MGNWQARGLSSKNLWVGKFVAAGFAGSVEIGFAMINDLRSVLSGLPADKAWIPRWVALKWWRRARRIYNHYPNVPAKQLGCSIMLIGVSSQLVPGQEWPRSDIITMKSQNDFVPKIAQPGEALSVGSGGNVERYVEWLNEFMTDNFPYMQGEGHYLKKQTKKINPAHFLAIYLNNKS